MRPGVGDPIDPDGITKLEPIDEYQLTKVYGKRERFNGWELPELTTRPGDKNRKFNGVMQQMFCKYRTDAGKLVWGEWWTMNVDGRGSMNSDVAPGYKLEYDKKAGSYMPTLVPVETQQFSQFFAADQ
ncbi:MAG TPA: hypothetical protein VG317_07480 [Pseudonocardiaceae bacterium]|jgi:hypothetical protein|nr:hypothetical protein [Pseudonocardiaceae bacterium]